MALRYRFCGAMSRANLLQGRGVIEDPKSARITPNRRISELFSRRGAPLSPLVDCSFVLLSRPCRQRTEHACVARMLVDLQDACTYGVEGSTRHKHRDSPLSVGLIDRWCQGVVPLHRSGFPDLAPHYSTLVEAKVAL